MQDTGGLSFLALPDAWPNSSPSSIPSFLGPGAPVGEGGPEALARLSHRRSTPTQRPAETLHAGPSRGGLEDAVRHGLGSAGWSGLHPLPGFELPAFLQLFLFTVAHGEGAAASLQQDRKPKQFFADIDDTVPKV